MRWRSPSLGVVLAAAVISFLLVDLPEASRPGGALGRPADGNATGSPSPLVPNGGSASLLPPLPVLVSGLDRADEPYIAVGPDGTVYISALQHVFRSTDGGASFVELDRPIWTDELVYLTDSALDVDAEGRLYYAFDWPYAGSTGVCTSDDRGDSWDCNPAVVPGVTDRMWISAPRRDWALLATNAGVLETTLLQSTDGGSTFVSRGAAVPSGSGYTGPIRIDPRNPNRLLQPISETSLALGQGLFLLEWDLAAPASLAFPRATGLPIPGQLPNVAFDAAGQLFAAVESPDSDGGWPVLLGRSFDGGSTWTSIRIPGAYGTGTMPWVAAAEPGHVGILFYASDARGNPNGLHAADWRAVWAETRDADAPAPTWTLTTLEPLVHHGSICTLYVNNENFCTNGENGSPNGSFARHMITATFDRDGVGHAAWMADASGVNQVHYGHA